MAFMVSSFSKVSMTWLWYRQKKKYDNPEDNSYYKIREHSKAKQIKNNAYNHFNCVTILYSVFKYCWRIIHWRFNIDIPWGSWERLKKIQDKDRSFQENTIQENSKERDILCQKEPGTFGNLYIILERWLTKIVSVDLWCGNYDSHNVQSIWIIWEVCWNPLI